MDDKGKKDQGKREQQKKAQLNPKEKRKLKKEKKKRERYFLENARKMYPLFPAGDIIESESPDFLIKTDSGDIGIEITNLYQPKGDKNFPRIQIEDFHIKVMKRAEELFNGTNLPAVDVLVYFDNDDNSNDLESMAFALVNFVKKHYKEDQGIKIYQQSAQSYDLPKGFSIIRVAPPLDGGNNNWNSGESGDELSLNYEFLSSKIQRKNKRISNYNKNVKRLWLLLITSLFPLSGSFSIPREVETWKFYFDFEKVLLFSQEDSKVFELGHQQTQNWDQ